jgi:hypothetical protein
MSDRSDMTLTIGGPIKASRLEEVCETLLHVEGATEWEGEFLLEMESVEDAIREAVAKGESLWLCAREVSGGMDEEAEAALEENGVMYVRTSDAHYAYSASVAFWQPGMAEPREWAGDNDGMPYLSAGEIRKHLKDGTLQAELDLMMLACGPLPALSIVEG